MYCWPWSSNWLGTSLGPDKVGSPWGSLDQGAVLGEESFHSWFYTQLVACPRGSSTRFKMGRFGLESLALDEIAGAPRTGSDLKLWLLRQVLWLDVYSWWESRQTRGTRTLLWTGVSLDCLIPSNKCSVVALPPELFHPHVFLPPFVLMRWL